MLQDEQVLDIVRLQLPGILEVYRKKDFLLWRNAKDGSAQEVSLEVLDAGPNFDSERRFTCVARTSNGRSAKGNSARTVETALALVHWWDLD